MSLSPWIPDKPPQDDVYFGLDRKARSARFDRPSAVVPGRLRRWVGYKLYAVVYWLLGGHA